MGGDDSKPSNIYYTKFESPCPCCHNFKNIYWVHSIDDSHETTNNIGDIKCNNTDCYYYGKLSFIMNWAFYCRDIIKKMAKIILSLEKLEQLVPFICWLIMEI